MFYDEDESVDVECSLLHAEINTLCDHIGSVTLRDARGFSEAKALVVHRMQDRRAMHSVLRKVLLEASGEFVGAHDWGPFQFSSYVREMPVLQRARTTALGSWLQPAAFA